MEPKWRALLQVQRGAAAGNLGQSRLNKSINILIYKHLYFFWHTVCCKYSMCTHKCSHTPVHTHNACTHKCTHMQVHLHACAHTPPCSSTPPCTLTPRAHSHSQPAAGCPLAPPRPRVSGGVPGRAMPPSSPFRPPLSPSPPVPPAPSHLLRPRRSLGGRSRPSPA